MRITRIALVLLGLSAAAWCQSRPTSLPASNPSATGRWTPATMGIAPPAAGEKAEVERQYRLLYDMFNELMADAASAGSAALAEKYLAEFNRLLDGRVLAASAVYVPGQKYLVLVDKTFPAAKGRSLPQIPWLEAASRPHYLPGKDCVVLKNAKGPDGTFDRNITSILILSTTPVTTAPTSRKD